MSNAASNLTASENATTQGSLATVDQLLGSLDSIVPIFVLIDPMVGEPAFISGVETGVDPQSTRESGWQRHVVQIALSDRCSLPLHLQPYLVALEGASDPLLELTLELAHEERVAAMADGLDGHGMAVHRIGGWVQSSMHPEQLAERLGSMFRINTEAYTKATYLRLADRRTFALLRHVAGDTRVAAQFGRLQRWCYLDMQGKLSTLDSPAEEPSVLRLSRDEWLVLEQGELLNRTLAQWLGEAERLGDNRYTQTPAQELYAPLKTAIANAKPIVQRWPHRFLNLADQTAWAALSLVSPALPLSGSVARLLAQPGTHDDPPEPFRYLHHQASAILQAEASPEQGAISALSRTTPYTGTP